MSQGKSSSRGGWRDKKSSPSFWSGWRDRNARKPLTPAQQLLGYLLAFVALAIVFVYILLRRPTRTDFLAVGVKEVQEFDALVLPNAYAKEDFEQFRQAFGSGKKIDFWSKIVDASDDDLETILDDQLKKRSPGGPDKRWPWSRSGAVIVYVSAHGVVDEDGNPCLLTNRADPLKSETWLSVSELLEAVKRPRLQEATKLVILDAGKMPDNWAMGVVSNTFADRLADLVEDARKDDPNLFVLNATMRDQQGWTAPELSASFFGRHVARGLDGAADGYNQDNRKDKKVSLQELRDYLVDEVDDMVFEFRKQRQQPILMPDDDQSISHRMLAFCGGTSPSAGSPDERMKRVNRLKELTEKLSELGETRDRLHEDRPSLASTHPRQWMAIDHDLRRLDDLLLAGEAYQQTFDNLILSVKDKLERLGNVKWPSRQPSGCSIPLARKAGWLPDADKKLAESVFADWRKWQENRKPNDLMPEELKKQWDELRAKPDERAYLAAAAAGWEWIALRSTSVNREHIRRALNFIQQFPRKLDCPEVHVLALLAGGLDWQKKSAVPAAYLAAERKANLVTAGEDLRSHYGVAKQLSRADHQLRIARDHLFLGKPVDWPQIKENWQTIHQDQRRISDAHEIRDVCLSELPELAYWLWVTQPDQLGVLRNLAESVHTLSEELAALDEPDGETLERLETIDGEQGQVRKNHKNIRDMASRRIGDLLRQVGAAQDLAEAEFTLRRSWLSGKQRERLRNRYVSWLESWSERPEPESDVPDSDAPRRTLTAHHPAGLLLPVSLFDPQGPRARDLPEVPAADQLDEAVWSYYERLGGVLRTRLARLSEIQQGIKQTTAGLKKHPVRKVRTALARVDRLARAVAGLHADLLARSEDPCRALFKLDANNLLLWHAARALDDFWGSLVLEDRDPYFVTAAKEFQEAVDEKPLPEFAAMRLRQQRRTQLACIKAWKGPQLEDPYVEPRSGVVEIAPDLDILPADALPGLSDAEDQPEAAFFVRFGTRELELELEGNGVSTRTRWPHVLTSAAGPARPSFRMRLDDRMLDSMLQANSFFRGHLRRVDFSPIPVGETMVRVPGTRYGPPTVRVSEAGELTSQVIFVFDCSYSMLKEMDSADGGTSPRFDIAKKQLLVIVGKLQQRKTYAIGLMLYGHRAGIYSDGTRRKGSVRGVDPDTDVEMVLEVPHRPSLNVVEDVDEVITRYKPFGVTPLYLAIKTALDKFRPDIKGPRHVVVISDGVNWLTTDKPSWRYTTQAEVVNSLSRKPNHRVDVLLLEGEKEEADKLRELEKICTESGGQLFSVANESALIEYLGDSLFDTRFLVRRQSADASSVQLEQEPLTATIEVRDFSGAADYDVEVRALNRKEPVARKTVRLEGGEALDLQYEHRDHSLVFSRYERDAVRAPQTVNGHEIRLHRPLVQAGGTTLVTAMVSLQKPREKQSEFSRRPRHIWAELRPLVADPDAEGKTYYFQDRHFQEGVPVPVLQLPARDFPSQAFQLDLWFSFAKDVHDKEFLLEDLWPDQPAIPTWRRDTKVSCEVNEDKRQYIITTEPQGTALADPTTYPPRIHMDPPPFSIRRGYTDVLQKARYIFTYQDPPVNPRLLIGRKHDGSSRWLQCEPMTHSW